MKYKFLLLLGAVVLAGGFYYTQPQKEAVLVVSPDDGEVIEEVELEPVYELTPREEKELLQKLANLHDRI